MHSLKRVFEYKNFKSAFMLLIGLTIIENIIIVLAVPYFFNLVLNEKVNSGNIREILVFGLLFILLNIFRGCYMQYLGYRTKKNQIEIDNSLKKDVFSSLSKEKIERYSNNRTSDDLKLVVNDSEDASKFFHTFDKLYIMGILRALTLIIIMSYYDLKLGLITVLVYFIGYSIIIFANKYSIKYINKKRNDETDLINYTNEATYGFDTVKLLGIFKYRKNKMQELLQALKKHSFELDKVTRTYTIIYEIVTFAITMSIVYFGGLDLASGVCSFAALTFIIQNSGTASNYISWVVTGMPDYNNQKVAFERVLDYLESSNQEDLEKGISLDKIESIEFKNIDFAYNTDNVIKEFSLSINSNDKVALVGKTGSGKSTIINLLCRFYDVTKGEILVNGKNINNYKLKDLRSRIGYVMQENTIFDGTVLENINYANLSLKEDTIINACKKIGLHEHIMKLPDGYKTTLKNDGDILSSGEKQLLCFARIMLTNPDIILLDEVTSSLSYETEMKIQSAIKEVTKNKMCIIVAHRLSTIRDCKKIVLMQDGKIEEVGTNDELIEKQGMYYELVT